MSTNRALYNANDGLTGRDGGPYLDLEENRLSEERRARIEGRKPDLVNPAASSGTQLRTASQQFANAGVNNLPSQSDTVASAENSLKAIADDKSNLLQPHGVIAAEAFTPPEEAADLSTRTALASDGTRSEGEKNTEPSEKQKSAAKKVATAVNKVAKSAMPAKKTAATAPVGSSHSNVKSGEGSASIAN